MSSEEEKKFIEIISQDVEYLIKKIKMNEAELSKKLDNLIRDCGNFKIQDNYFTSIVNKYLFDSDIGGYLAPKNKAFEIRYSLFNNILLEKLEASQVKQIFNYAFDYFVVLYKSPELLYMLYHEILRQFYLYGNNSVDILNNIIREWNQSFLESLLNVTIIVPLSNLNIIEEKILSSDLKITMRDVYEIITETEKIPHNINNLLTLNAQISFGGQQDIQFNERKEITLKINEVLMSFYLCGIEFKKARYILLSPWWIESYNQEKLQNLAAWVGYNYPVDINSILKTYNAIKNSKIMQNKNWDIIVSRYMEIYNRDTLLDILLDVAIIFEIILTRGLRQELGYRFRTNGAFFLGEDEQDFDNYYKFFQSLYEIRSSIVHGGNWKNELNNQIGKLNFISEFEYKKELFRILNLTLLKLIDLQLTQNTSLTELKGLFFIKSFLNRNKKEEVR